MFDITVICNDGQKVLNGYVNSVPRIGEKVISNGNKFVVKDVVYDFGYGTHHNQIKVNIYVAWV